MSQTQITAHRTAGVSQPRRNKVFNIYARPPLRTSARPRGNAHGGREPVWPRPARDRQNRLRRKIRAGSAMYFPFLQRALKHRASLTLSRSSIVGTVIHVVPPSARDCANVPLRPQMSADAKPVQIPRHHAARRANARASRHPCSPGGTRNRSPPRPRSRQCAFFVVVERRCHAVAS